MPKKKRQKIQTFPQGSLDNICVKLYSPRNWYILKKNGDVVMRQKVDVSSKIKIRLI